MLAVQAAMNVVVEPGVDTHLVHHGQVSAHRDERVHAARVAGGGSGGRRDA